MGKKDGLLIFDYVLDHFSLPLFFTDSITICLIVGGTVVFAAPYAVCMLVFDVFVHIR